MNRKSLQTLVYLFFGLILFAVLYFVILSIARIGTYPVAVAILPTDAELTIDSKAQSGNVLHLKPGTYTWTVQKEGFDDSSGKVTVDKGSQSTIAASLTPVSAEATTWVNNNPELYQKFEEQAGIRANKSGQDFSSQNPITKKLPYTTLLYSIGYRTDTNDSSGNSIIIEIDAPEGYRNAALEHIRTLGYDPADFTINFRGYSNPFL